MFCFVFINFLFISIFSLLLVCPAGQTLILEPGSREGLIKWLVGCLLINCDGLLKKICRVGQTEIKSAVSDSLSSSEDNYKFDFKQKPLNCQLQQH